MSRARAFALTAGLAAAVGLAGCGGSTDPVHAVTSAAQLTFGQTVQASLSYAGAPQLGISAEVHGKAALFPDGFAATGLVVPAEAGEASGVLLLIFRPAFAYFGVSSSAAARVPSGKTIVSIPLSGSGSGATAKVAAEVEGFNVQLLLDELAWGTAAATSTGHQVLAQLPLNRYSVSVSLSQTLARVSGPGAAAMRQALRAQLAANTGMVRMTVWVDGPGRVARIKTPLPGLGLGSVTAIFSQYGAKLAETAQPPALVVPLASLHAPPGKATQSPLVTFGLGR